MSDYKALNKSLKDIENKKLEKMTDDASKFLGGLLGDISTKSATFQIIAGTVSGWVTGYVTLKVGKLAAFAIGTSIIVIEVARQQGIITVDWNKIQDKVEGVVAPESQTWVDKAERFVDRKINKAEKKAKKWYTKIIGDDKGPKFNELHLFLTAFAGGVFIGIATA